MDEEARSTLRAIFDKLQEVALTLKRIEDRQIAVREEIKEQGPSVVGSFGSTEG